MLRNADPALGDVLPWKLVTLCDRMLGPAKPEDETAAVLSFLRDIGLPFANPPLRGGFQSWCPRTTL
jgi:hypothetical protein